MSKVNKSLTAFTTFIGASLIFGIVSGLIGAIVLSYALGGGGGSGLLWGIILIYLGAGLIGLSLMGAFLRQTARVVVEGMDGNLFEGVSNVNSTDGAPASLGKLTSRQCDAWINAGQPDLSTWDGRPWTFDNWLDTQK